MPIRALNDRKKLPADFHEANDAFIDEVLGALRSGRIDKALSGHDLGPVGRYAIPVLAVAMGTLLRFLAPLDVAPFLLYLPLVFLGCAEVPVVVLNARDVSAVERRRLAGADRVLRKSDVSLRGLRGRRLLPLRRARRRAG